MQHYVLTLVFDPRTFHLVTLIKKKGPAFLIGKLTAPGGKRDLLSTGLETPQQAASREIAEETSLHVPESDWSVLTTKQGDWGSLVVLAAPHEGVLHARTMEVEEVSVHTIDVLLSMPRDTLAPDLPELLELLLHHVYTAP